MTNKVLLLDLIRERIHASINGLEHMREVKMIKEIKTKESRKYWSGTPCSSKHKMTSLNIRDRSAKLLWYARYTGHKGE